MPVKRLGQLEVDERDGPLLISALNNFRDFTNNFPLPEKLRSFLAKHKHVPTEREGVCLGWCGNVGPHVDDADLSIVWVVTKTGSDLTLIVQNEYFFDLQVGDVYVFNPSRRHCVMSTQNDPYVMYLLNVKKVKKT